MDDFVFFHQEKSVLKDLQQSVTGFLSQELKLSLKARACFFNQASNGLTFLGRRIFPNTVRIARPNLQRLKRRVKKRQTEFNSGIIGEEQFLASMNSYQTQTAPFYTYPSGQCRWRRLKPPVQEGLQRLKVAGIQLCKIDKKPG